MSQTFLERFWSKVEIGKPDECWPWKARRLKSGYGAFHITVDGEWRPTTAHRVALRLSGVILAANEYACHRCDNPPCCNPRHLFAATPRVNFLDAVKKGRRAVGDDHPLAKLDFRQIAEIRKLSAAGKRQTYIARQFHVTQSTISRVVTHKRNTK